MINQSEPIAVTENILIDVDNTTKEGNCSLEMNNSQTRMTWQQLYVLEKLLIVKEQIRLNEKLSIGDRKKILLIINA